MSKLILTFLIICGVYTMVLAKDGFVLVDKGEANVDIVLPVNPNNVEKYAAAELQKHIEKATKCKLAVISEDKVKKRFNIYLGNTQAAGRNHIFTEKLPVNAWSIKITDRDIILAGKDGNGILPKDDTTPMGTLFAVYNYLDNKLGVRWLWPGELGTFVPETNSLLSGPPIDKTHIPKLLHSRMRDPELTGWHNFYSRKEYQDSLLERQIWLRRHQFACGTSFEYGHGYGKYWSRFKKTHPDFFALRPDGKRAPIDKRTYLVQLCVSNPELHKQIIKDWLKQRDDYPRLPWINGIENDRRSLDPPCQCKNCRAWDAAKKSYSKDSAYLITTDKKADRDFSLELSDRYAKFWLALQREGEKYDPENIVLGYAYSNYANPPKETKLNGRIIVGIVPNFDYPLDNAHRNDFINQWKGWSDTGAGLYLRPNYFLAGYCLPYIYAHQFGHDYKYAYNHMMIGTDFDSLTGMFGTQGTNLYMVARLNDSPEMTVEEVLSDYYSTFGNAAPEIKKYFDLWEKLTRQRDSEFQKKYPEGGWLHMGVSGNKLYSPADIVKAEKILNKAEKLACNDKGVLARIDFLKKGLKHTSLTLKTITAFQAYKVDRKNPELKSKFDKSLKALDAYRYEIRNDQIVNIPLLLKLEVWLGWRNSKIIKAAKLTNPEIMESLFDDNGIIWKTQCVKGTCSFGCDPTGFKGDKPSAFIECTDLDKSEKSWARYYVDLTVKAGQKYKLKLHVKTSSDFNGSVQVWPPGKSRLSIKPTVGVWQEFILNFVAGKSSRLYLNLWNGTGKVSFAEMSLEAIGP